MQELFEFVTALELEGVTDEESEAAYLEQLLEVAKDRPAMTEQELMDENVFQQIFIPRTLVDVGDPEKEKAAKSKQYLGVIGVIGDDADGAAGQDDEGEGDAGEDDDEESESDEDESALTKLTGFMPQSPAGAARSAALYCAAGLDLPVPIRKLIGEYIWATKEESDWVKLFRRLNTPSKEDLKREKRLNRIKVKKDQAENRKTKIPKKVKKRQIKTSQKKKRR
jgi:hypothetical protein